MVDVSSGWSRADVIGAWTLVPTIAGAVAAWLAIPGFREWLKRFQHISDPISLGSLTNAAQAEYSMPVGVAKAAAKTLAEINHALPASTMEWLHEKDFGNAFRWSAIEAVELFAWLPAVPAREFLDRELEVLRLNLVVAAKEFIRLAASETDEIHPSGDDDIRKIPDQYDDCGRYSDRLFFCKQQELNDAAEKVWSTYQALFRRTRVKLAHSQVSEEVV